MGWVKLDDGFFRNPKVLRVGRDAKLLYLAGLCYSGSSLTDGFIPANAPKVLAADAEVSSAKRPTQELVDAGLWKETEGGYMIHDYLSFNQSAAKVHANRDAARERMQRGRSREHPDGSPNVRANNARSSRDVREQDTDRDTEHSVSSTTSPKRAAVPPGGSGSTKAAKLTSAPLPANGPAQQIVQAFCEATGLARPAAYAKAVGQAQKLADASCTPGDIPAIVSWLRGQPRFRGEIDLGIVLAEFDKWRTARTLPANDAYLEAFGQPIVAKLAGWLGELSETFGGESWVVQCLRRLADEVPGLTTDQLKRGIKLGFDRAEVTLKAKDQTVANPPALVHSMFRQALTEQREARS